MSILQEIQDASNKTKQDVISGLDVNDSLIKNTSGFTKDAVQRVIEEVNVNRFLDVLKTGENRSQHFPLADPQVIFKKTAETSLKKTALLKYAEHDVPGLDFYDREDYNLAKYAMPKLPITPNKKPDISSHNVKYILGKKEITEKRAEMNLDIVNKCDSMATECIQKVAEYISNSPRKALSLSVNSLKKYGQDVKTVLPHIFKLANIDSGEFLKLASEYNDNNGIYYEDCNGAIDQVGYILSSIEKRAAFNRQHSIEVAKVNGINNFIKSAAYDREWKLMDQIDSLKEKQKKKKWDRAKDIGGLAKGTVKGIGESIGQSIGGVSEIASRPFFSDKQKSMAKDYLQSGPTQQDMQADLQKDIDVADKFGKALKQKGVFEELVNTDTILMEQDPVALSNAYSTLVNIAPNVAANPEITRSILRTISSQIEPTIDPLYARELIKLDQSM